MFNAPEAAIVTQPRMALVQQAETQYAKTGETDQALLSEIGSAMIPEQRSGRMRAATQIRGEKNETLHCFCSTQSLRRLCGGNEFLRLCSYIRN